MAVPWKKQNKMTIPTLIIDWLTCQADGSVIASHMIQENCTSYIRTMKGGGVLPSTVERAWRKLRNENFATLHNHGIKLEPLGEKYGELNWKLKLSM
tara:strand:- start:2932 stop:3222 length:291 start_codon:yes stop_codon:yes gene_type:complete